MISLAEETPLLRAMRSMTLRDQITMPIITHSAAAIAIQPITAS